MKPNVKERRFYATEFECRADSSGTTIEGHGAVFGRTSQNLGGFVERVAPTAFNRTLKHGPDTRALFNHDANLILGRSTAGTLDLATDESGLYYRIHTAEKQRSYESDLLTSLERGDVSQSSFGFFVLDDAWDLTDDGFPLRTLTEVSLDQGDVSPVTFPAYLDTDSAKHALRTLGVEPDADPEEIARFISGDKSASAVWPLSQKWVEATREQIEQPQAAESTEDGSAKTPPVPRSILEKQLELKKLASAR